MKNFKQGFTLLEILLVVGIISLLAGIVIIAINPSKQLATVRNAERKSDIKQLNSAINQYYISNGIYPASIQNVITLAEVCDTGTASSTHNIDCATNNLVDLSILVPTYIAAIPIDPQGPITLNPLINTVYAAENGTGYYVMKDTTNKIVVVSERAELGSIIAIGTTTVAVTEGEAPGDTTAPTVTAFVVPSTASSLTVDITTFTTTDAVGVTGYKLTESATPPLAGDFGWTGTAPTSYTFSTEGLKTLYAWAKDAANNVSASLNDSVTITISVACGDPTNLDCWATQSPDGYGLAWSTESVATGAQSDTDGMSNTNTIMNFSTGENYPAAEYCDNLEEGGYHDWYLPSVNQLIAGSEVYRYAGPDWGGFANGTWYWSSTEYSGNDAGMSSQNGAWAVYYDTFAGGILYYVDYKNVSDFQVHCIR